jgi:hypothetical protein
VVIILRDAILCERKVSLATFTLACDARTLTFSSLTSPLCFVFFGFSFELQIFDQGQSPSNSNYNSCAKAVRRS